MIEAKFPPYTPTIEELTDRYYRGFGVHKPAMPEVDARRAGMSAEINYKSNVDLNAVGRDTIQDLIEEKRTTQVGGTHYEEMNIQPWEVFRRSNTPEVYCTYHTNTVIGYLMRHDKKGGLVDIKKAADHLRELIRYFEEEEDYPW